LNKINNTGRLREGVGQHADELLNR